MSARQRLVDATVAQMRRHGVAGASVSGILERSGLARRTLYLNFPDGKPALVVAATESAAASISAAFQALPSDAGPVEMVEAFIALWAKTLSDSDFRAGCPIAAAALGRDEAPDAADVAGAAFAGWVDRLSAVATQSGLDDEGAEDLATTIVAVVEGAIIMSIAQRSTEPLERAGRDLVLLTRTKLTAA